MPERKSIHELRKKFLNHCFDVLFNLMIDVKNSCFFLQSKQHSTFLPHVSGAGSIRKKSDKLLEALDLNMLHERTETISVS